MAKGSERDNRKRCYENDQRERQERGGVNKMKEGEI